MKTMTHRIFLLAQWTVDHYWNFVTGIFFAFISYFAEIKGAFHVMFAAFMIDMAVGIWAAKKIRGERFSMHKFFLAFKRMLISYALVMLLYSMDREMHQDTLSLANMSSWIISGFLIYSIAENGFEITGGRLFLIIKSLIGKKVKDNTGINIE